MSEIHVLALLLVHDLYGAVLQLVLAIHRGAEAKLRKSQIRRLLAGVDVIILKMLRLVELVDHATWTQNVLSADHVAARRTRRLIILVEIRRSVL